MQNTRHKIIHGDSREMYSLPDNSIQLVVTSPPYWQLKDYGTDNQIGYQDTYEKYINNLNLVWKECYRVLHNGCRLCVNIGDQFARSVCYGRYKVIPIREEIIRFCENIGLDYMGAIIWKKMTTTNTTGGGVQMGSYPFPRNGILKIDYEFILLFKKLGQAPKPSIEQKELSRMTNEEWNTYFAGHWHFAGAKQDQHIAMFPEELPTRLIKMFAFAGDTVLDPFAGSGTTCLAAKKLGRNSIGFEINAAFIEIIKQKLSVNNDPYNGAQFEFLRQDAPPDFDKKLQQLPYLFKDPHSLDKKNDPKKLRFGSKISTLRETIPVKFFTVKQVISPECVVLGNNLVVRLIGIKEDPAINGKAKEFLQTKTKGRKVFLKYDQQIHDQDNNLMAYLYLQNKTFLNAHLVKLGLVQVDMDREFKYREKFVKLRKKYLDWHQAL